jgi:hypothetical protein
VLGYFFLASSFFTVWSAAMCFLIWRQFAYSKSMELPISRLILDEKNKDNSQETSKSQSELSKAQYEAGLSTC